MSMGVRPRSPSPTATACRYTQANLLSHFTALAEEVHPFPIVLYNVPSRTGVDLLPETVGELARGCGNIVGIKEATGDVGRVKTLRELCGEDFLLYR